MHISRLFKPERLEEMIAEGFVNVQTHPTLDLRILNYSNTCQYGRVWNDVTLNCRGLIIDGDDNIIARPFPKFFNIEELPRSDVRLSKKDFQVFEKLDGSMGVLYPTLNGWDIATRGSFTSDQAVRGTKVLHELLDGVPFVPAEGHTYVFEIIYPENRIVVNYSDLDSLVFLCAINNETGANVFQFGNELHDWPGLVAARYDVSCHPRDIADKYPLDNAEGYVIYFPSSNFRVKAKFEEYVRLHRIVTGVSTKTIWKSLSVGESLNDVLDNVPDEFYSWVRHVEAELNAKFQEVYDRAVNSFQNIITKMGGIEIARKDRKTFADHAVKVKLSGLQFKQLDGKPIINDVWKMIEPEFARPHIWDEDNE